MNTFPRFFPAPAPHAARARGFTLIELMISVALGLIILAALTSFFVSTSQNRREIDRNAQQIENGRFAMSSIRDDLTHSGFYADIGTNIPSAVWTTPVACNTNMATAGFLPNQLTPNYPVPIFGYPMGAGAPACVLTPPGGANYLTGDVLVVRRFNTESVTPATAAASYPQQWFVQISECGTDPVYNPPAVPVGIPFQLAVGSSGTFTLHKLDCATPANVWRYREEIYYVAGCSVCAPSDGLPTLWRAELDLTNPTGINSMPVVEGIQDFRVDYGVDNDGDGLPDVWRRCDAASPCTAADWTNVMAAKVYVLSRNLETSPGYVDNKTYTMGLSGTVGPFNDAYKRHVYTAQVSLPNRVGPREPKL